jgi:P pilus assembly chaperone PapD
MQGNVMFQSRLYESSGSSKKDVTVFNSDELANLYLEVTPFKVVNPGENDQVMEPIDYEGTPEFLASPNRLIVGAGERATIRLLNLGKPSDVEAIYRINLVPVNPPIEFSDVENNEVQSRLQVIIAYQVLAIVLPENPSVNFEYKRNSRLVNFTNSGNSNYLLTNGEQCDPQQPDTCTILESRRIYPGNNWSLELPYDGPAQFTVRTHEGSSSVLIK